MTTKEFKSVVNEKSIAKCLEYSDEPEKLKELLNDEFFDVRVKFNGIKKHFADDKKERLTGTFLIMGKRNHIEFDFGFSINDTEIFDDTDKYRFRGKNYNTTAHLLKAKFEARQKFNDDLLYSALTCCKSDYHIPIDFDEFCSDFGYDTDSIKAKTTWEGCLKQSAKLQKVFTEEQINWLPS